MSICVKVQPNGTLKLKNVAVESCTDFLLTTVQEFNQFSTFQNFFVVPPAEELQEIFLFGFLTPSIIFLVSWALQKLVSAFN